MLSRDLLRLLSDERPRLGWWVLLVVLSVGFALLELVGSLAILSLLRLFIDGGAPSVSVASLDLTAPAGTPEESIRVALALGLVAIFFVRAALLVAVSYLGARLSTMASVRIARRLLSGYLHLPYVEHIQRRTNEMVRDTFVSTERLHQHVTRPLTMLLSDGIISVGLVLALLLVDARSTALAAAFLLAATLLVQRLVRPRLRAWGGRAEEATAASIEVVQQAVAGIRDIRLLGQEQRFLQHHDRERRALARFRYLSAASQSVPRSTVELATIMSIMILLWNFGGLSGGSQEALPFLGTFAYVGLRLQPILNRFVLHANEIRANQVLIEQLLAERERLSVRTSGSLSGGAERTPPAHIGSPPVIEFRDVSFAYPAPDDEPPIMVLRSVDLVIPIGAFVGVVGPTGGGKSTLLNLLVGLLEPTSGSVTVDGVPLDQSPTWWWQQIGFVPQAPYLTPATIRENVAFSHPAPSSPDAEERIWECLEVVQLSTTVRALPHGLDTTVGEHGIRLSGGQRQRLALARAVFRDPSVLVLDEATSALDEATEARVLAALLEQRRAGATPRTLIVVTHRHSTIISANIRVEVVEGSIA